MELDRERVIALAGNPNVGKSTVFNALTGLHQHTGNWPGKTVATARGRCRHRGMDYVLVDLPGTYSLMAHSPEEEVARDFFCFGGADGAVVVCDATCLERNLNLVLQVLELQPRTVVCVNLLDEAERKGVRVDLEELSRRLGVPAVGTCAGRGQGLDQLLDQVESVLEKPPKPLAVRYPPPVEFAVATLTPLLGRRLKGRLPARWTALRLLEGDGSLLDALSAALDWDPRKDNEVWRAVIEAREALAHQGLDPAELNGVLVSALLEAARGAARAAVTARRDPVEDRDRRLDRLLTHRATAVPLMILLLAGVLWLTIQGANYPSALLSGALFWVQDRLSELFVWLGAPAWLHGALVLGVYRVLAWVISVMLPPMAIFFPLFTLLEDFGYLPRVAFLLDHAFQKARACGKQALTMCMGFGCNAAGVVGCRIIDSPRERLIAILTNSFVPCNGRFPTLIAVITMFFVGAEGGAWAGLSAALLLTGVILLGVLATFQISRLLSATVLKGVPSSFTLELPPYRRPRVGQVILRSILDRTIFVLGRAAAVAAPAGLVIWLCANVTVGELSVLDHVTGFLDPFARLLGLDGVILAAFILGFPANEIVIPIAIMAYLSTGTIQEMEGLGALHQLLTDHGWTWLTAVCTLLFSLFHWPCSTTCISIAKESGSVRWTLLGILLPTGVGMALCFCVATAARLLHLV
ncbi:ferrous iron transport protein B [Intestinimonas massiliensis (ex Afouda et al. 2020)]|uniref:ferrous iron transport protein B n=1 Tax=Intestinimonas massiliensis (ex Afouda et al. 2020) TaxID=1673721 RepID=UPI001F5FF411|nr:ferrous iron transport protein B [Intestinimonas massiliensis (ex Afouda et al. 2020)]